MHIPLERRFQTTLPRVALLALATALTACGAEKDSAWGTPPTEEATTTSKEAAGRGDSTNKTANDAGVATANRAQQGMSQGPVGGSAAGAPAAAASTGQAGSGNNPAPSPSMPSTPSSATPPVMPPKVMPPTSAASAGVIDSGISDECNAQLAQCNAVSPDLLRECVAVVRHCLPAEVSAKCDAQLDKCEKGNEPLIDCPLVAVVCP